jgi:crotonobetainyl-CoA:carnitine CoA-transferase CaiB-like acyl-CoA transferase
MSITGTEDGEVVRSGYAVCDINAGLFAAIGILMALRHRDRTGLGQFVDISMFDGMISAMSSNYMTYLGSGVVPKPLGTAFPTVVPYRVFHARDGDFSISVGSEKLWAAFCSAIGQQQLTAHADYATNALRIKNRVALEKVLSEVFGALTRDEWLQKLGSAGIPCSSVRTFDDVVEHPQAVSREMFPLLEQQACRVTGAPIKMSETPPKSVTGAPGLGQHTKEVLASLLGISGPELSGLTAEGTVAVPSES